MQPLLEEVWRLPRGESDFVTVVVPEQFKRASLLSAAGRDVVPAQAPPALRAGRRRHRRAGGDGPARAGRADAERLAVRVLVANVHAGSLRALDYAQSLGVEDTRAVSFAFDAEEAAKVRGGVDGRRASDAARPAARRRTATSARRSSPTCAS